MFHASPHSREEKGQVFVTSTLFFFILLSLLQCGEGAAATERYIAKVVTPGVNGWHCGTKAEIGVLTTIKPGVYIQYDNLKVVKKIDYSLLNIGKTIESIAVPANNGICYKEYPGLFSREPYLVHAIVQATICTTAGNTVDVCKSSIPATDNLMTFYDETYEAVTRYDEKARSVTLSSKREDTGLTYC